MTQLTTNRQQELADVTDRLTDRESVVDAWLAKSFTDRLLVVELETGTDLPPTVRETLDEHGLRGYNDVYGLDTDDAAFAGRLERGDRYQFVDVRERGELQSYVVE